MDLEAAWATASGLLEDGRAVIFMEPSKRFTNRLSINLLAAQDAFVVEMLGLGYDVSDLNRDAISPQVTIAASGINWSEYEHLPRSSIQVRLDLGHETGARRLHRRLEIVGMECLPALGAKPEADPVHAAEKWLRSRRHTSLWDQWQPLYP